MNGPLHQFFTKDHRRIEALLDKATENPNEIIMEHYQLFRTGLLTHIKMEENILFPAVLKANGNVSLPILPQLRLDHGALTALMVPPPTAGLIKVLRYILDKHDIAEEEQGGLYEICEHLTEGQTEDLLEQLRNITEVPVLKPNTASFVLDATKRALARAGYNYDELAQ